MITLIFYQVMVHLNGFNYGCLSLARRIRSNLKIVIRNIKAQVVKEAGCAGFGGKPAANRLPGGFQPSAGFIVYAPISAEPEARA